MVIDFGRMTSALDDASPTVTPAAGAGPVSTTVAVDDLPPSTAVGSTAIEDADGGGSSMSVADTCPGVIVFDDPSLIVVVMPLVVVCVAVFAGFAVMIARAALATGVVVILNVCRSAVAGTVMDAGTDAFTLDDVNVTARPCDGVGPLNTTVPVVVAPPISLAGLS